MADLTNQEKRGLEKLFGMASGYVLDFSNRTFEEFVRDSTGDCIYEPWYATTGESKACRLRSFWQREPNRRVGKLLKDLLDYVSESGIKPEEKQLFENGRKAAQRLLQSGAVDEIGALVPNSSEKDFSVLAKSVRESIERNEPEAGLDRLHTFTVKYLRVLCEKRGIVTEKEKPLHSLMGEYIKRLKDGGAIESRMTELILKSSISTLESFNQVRNNQSLAHDNRLLNYDESLLIFNYVCSAVRFMQAVERSDSVKKHAIQPEEEIPF